MISIPKSSSWSATELGAYYKRRNLQMSLPNSARSTPSPTSIASNIVGHSPVAPTSFGYWPTEVTALYLNPTIEMDLQRINARDDFKTFKPVHMVSLDQLDQPNEILSKRLQTTILTIANLISKHCDIKLNELDISIQQDTPTPFDSSSRHTKFDLHWDYYQDSFEAHKNLKPPPIFPNWLVYCGESFTPTQFVPVLPNDLFKMGYHPSQCDSFSTFRHHINKVLKNQSLSLHSRFQFFPSSTLHYAPGRGPAELFAALRLKDERRHFTYQQGTR